MSNLLHIKGSRTQIYKTLPSNSVGNDGDIILSQIQGKGVYLCSKVNGRWHVSTKMEELRKIEKTSIKDLKLDRLKIGNTTITKDEYDVSSADLTLDVDGDIELNADGGQVSIKDGTATHFLFDCDATRFRIYDDTSALDHFTILVAANGATSLTTVDNDGASGNLTLDPDGDLNFSGCDVNIDATKKLYLDGGGDTYIVEGSADDIHFDIGGDRVLQLTESGTAGNVAWFRTSCVGFTRIEATFSTTGIIGSGGTDDTDIDFRHSNKYRLELTGDITTINLIFPPVSGNFVLTCRMNGDHDVANWKVFAGDASAATVTDVMWAGGSVPAFTEGAPIATDIVSFYWDANEEEAYGVASLAFATP